MFGQRYFGRRYFGPRYFGPVTSTVLGGSGLNTLYIRRRRR